MLVTVKYWHTYKIYTMYMYACSFKRCDGPLAYVWGHSESQIHMERRQTLIDQWHESLPA